MKTVNTYEYYNKYEQQILCLDFLISISFYIFKHKLTEKSKNWDSLTKLLLQPSCEVLLQKRLRKAPQKHD